MPRVYKPTLSDRTVEILAAVFFALVLLLCLLGAVWGIAFVFTHILSTIRDAGLTGPDCAP